MGGGLIQPHHFKSSFEKQKVDNNPTWMIKKVKKRYKGQTIFSCLSRSIIPEKNIISKLGKEGELRMHPPEILFQKVTSN